MSRIGIDARLVAYRTGGISTYTRQLISALEALAPQHNVTVFQSHRAKSPLAHHFHEVRLWTPPHHRLERVALSAELARFNLDVYHATDFIPPIRGGKRHVITVHDLTFLHYPEHKDRAAQRYYNDQIQTAVDTADHILAVSQATKADLIHELNVPAEKITVQPHGVDDRFCVLPQAQVTAQIKNLGIPQNAVLHVGTLEPRKNIPTLLDAYIALPDELRTKHPLLLVGRYGWLFEDTRHRIESLQKQGYNIVVRQDVDDSTLPLVYNSACVLVVPSFYEGFGMPVLEAMACGIPVITANNSALPEVAGDVGMVFNAQSPSALTVVLQNALTDAEWRTQAQQRGINHAAMFTWARSAQIALSVYESLSG